MKRTLLRGAALGVVLWLLLPAPGAWAAATIHIQNPNDPNGSSYNEWANSAIVTKTVPIHFESYATSGLAWAQVDILGIGGARDMIDRDPVGTASYSASSGKGTPSNPLVYDLVWNTADPSDLNGGRNGSFTMRYFVKEQFANSPDCSSTSRFNCKDTKFRVNNPPGPVDWVSGPTSSKDAGGRPVVHIAWSYSGNEPDMREFSITRDGSTISYVSWAGPGTYTFDDKSYSDSGYGGSHTYGVTALRTSSVGPNKCSSSGTYGTTCVGKASGSRSVSLVEPTQGSTPSSTPGGGSGSGGSRTGSDPGFRPAPVGTIIVGGRQITRTPCADCDEFFQGSYSTSLPYAPDRTILIPTRPGGGNGNSGNRLEAVADTQNSAPLGVPLRDRSVLLPFAGGLLLFLTAAHVRRLLRRI